MRIVWIGLLMVACGRPPQAGQVQSAASQEIVLGLMQNRGGAYELQLCKGGATGECTNPLVTEAGKAYSFSGAKAKSWWEQGLHWSIAGLAGVVGGVVFFRAARYILRHEAATDLTRALKVAEVEKQLTDKGQDMPERLRRGLQQRHLGRDEARQLLSLLDEDNAKIGQEADLISDWDKHVARLRDALEQGEAFTFGDEFDTGLTGMRDTLQALPSQQEALAKLNTLTGKLRKGGISKQQALRQLTALENRVQREVGEVLQKDWAEALQQARQALARSSNSEGRAAVKRGLRTMRKPLNKLDKQASSRRLQRLVRDGSRRADDIQAEIENIFETIGAVRQRTMRTIAARVEVEEKLDHRDELLRVLQDLELVARNSQQHSRARKLKSLASRITGGKADQGEIAKRMHSIDSNWQQSKDVHSDDAWESGLGQVDAILAADDSLNDYNELHAALRELQHLLKDIGDRRGANKVKKLEKTMAKRLKSKRSVSSSELDKFSEQAMQVVDGSRQYSKQIKPLEQGSAELHSGLEDSGIVLPKGALPRSLKKLESVLQKLAGEDELVQLREWQADIAAKRLSREDLEHNLAALDEQLRDKFASWQTSSTSVKEMLNDDVSPLEFNSNLAGIWDDMTQTLQASKLRKTFASEVEELRRYTMSGNRKKFDDKLMQLNAQVREVGSFRSADELHVTQGRDRRASRKELRQRIAELRRELQSGVKTKAASLDAALREGELVRKAAQEGRFAAWFDYGDGGERIINRKQVLGKLSQGDELDAIEVRIGLEKLAAQLTGAAIFIALPSAFDGQGSQSQPLVQLQRIAQAVDAHITPTASCWLGACTVD